MADEEIKTRLFYAKATDPNLCGVWDRHPDHPHAADEEVGEVFVSGDKVVQVAATPVVLDALAKGRIREVSGPPLDVPQPSQGNPASPAVGGKAPGDAMPSGRR